MLKALASSSLVLVMMPSIILAQEAQKAPLAEYVPSNALLYAAWAGRTTSLESTRLFQLLSELNVGRFLEEEAQKGLKQAKEWQASSPEKKDSEVREVEDADSAADPDYQKTAREYERQHERTAKSDLQRVLFLNVVANTWQRPMAFAVTAMGSRPQHNGEQGADELFAEWHWLIDIGTDRRRFDTQLQEILKALDMLKPQKTTQGWRLTLADERSLYLGYVREGVFCLTTQEDALTTLGGLPLEKSLAQSKRFQDHIGQVRGTAEIGLLYADYSLFLKQVTTALENEARREKLAAEYSQRGLDALQVFAGSIRADDEGWLYTKGLFFLKGKPVGVWSVFDQPSLRDEDIAYIPRDAYFFSAWKTSGRKLLDQIGTEKEGRSVLQSLGEGMREEVGVGLADWMPALGDTWVHSSSRSRGGLLAGMMLSATVSDAAMLDKAIATLKEHIAKPFVAPEGKGFLSNRPMTPYAHHVTKVGDIDVNYLLRKKEMLKLTTPAWAVHGGRFYLAAYPQAIAAVLRQPERDSLIASPAFASLRKKVSATPCMLGYIDTAGIVRDHYGMAVVAWGILANAQAGRRNGVMLPTSPRLAELLGQQVSAISLIGTTVVFEEYGSLPLFGLGSMPGGSPLGMLLAKPESVPLSLPSGLR